MGLNKILDKIEETHRSFLNDNAKPDLSKVAAEIISEYEMTSAQGGGSVTQASSFLTLIPRKRFASGLKTQLDHAQKDGWLSVNVEFDGPTMATRLLLAHDPLSYVKVAILLYETGQAQINRLAEIIEVPQSIKNLPKGLTDKTDEEIVDYVVIGSLREAIRSDTAEDRKRDIFDRYYWFYVIKSKTAWLPTMGLYKDQSILLLRKSNSSMEIDCKYQCIVGNTPYDFPFLSSANDEYQVVSSSYNAIRNAADLRRMIIKIVKNEFKKSDEIFSEYIYTKLQDRLEDMHLESSDDENYFFDTDPYSFNTIIAMSSNRPQSQIRIRYNAGKALGQIPVKAAIGVLAHELAHTAAGHRWGSEKEEHQTDLEAIFCGYGDELKAYRNWIYPKLKDEGARETKKTEYFTPSEIDLLVSELNINKNKNKNKPDEIAKLKATWLAKPPYLDEKLKKKAEKLKKKNE